MAESNDRSVMLSPDAYQQAQAALKEFQAVGSENLVVAAGVITQSPSKIKFDGASEVAGGAATTSEIKMRVASCREAYDNAGIFGNAIDLMVDFALEGFTITHEDRTIQRFYNAWATKVQLPRLAGQILKCYFRDGNVPILRFRGRIKQSEVKKLKMAIGQSLFESEDIPTRLIPYAYAILDFMQIDKIGSELLGTAIYEYSIPAEEMEMLTRAKATPDNTELAEALERLRLALGDDDFNLLMSGAKLRIPAERLTMLYYKKDDFKKWANPMFWRIINDLRFKQLMREMDVSVCESVINTLTIIALGDTPKGFPAPKEMFEKLANLLKTPTKSKTILWNDLIKVIAEYPPVERILGTEKYKQVDGDIRAGMGISEVILNGQGGNYATSFLSVKTLLERLEAGRCAILEWLDGEMAFIAKAMGFAMPPTVTMNFVSLRDEQAEKQLLLELVDRGMVSYETCIERFGETFGVELQRMKDEDNFRRKNQEKYPYVLVKTGKYGPSLQNGPIPVWGLLDTETVQNGKQSPTQQGGQGQKGGRPANKPLQPQSKQETPRNSPRGAKTTASISDAQLSIGGEIFDKLYTILATSFSKIRKVSVEQLTAKDNSVIYRTIACIISQFKTADEVDKNSVEAAIKSISHIHLDADLSLYHNNQLVKAIESGKAEVRLNPLNGNVQVAVCGVNFSKIMLRTSDASYEVSAGNVANLGSKHVGDLVGEKFEIELSRLTEPDSLVKGQLVVVSDDTNTVVHVFDSVVREYGDGMDHDMYRELVSSAFAAEKSNLGEE